MSISAVRDNIAKAVKLFAFQHTPVSVTGVSTETTLFSTIIPGGTLGTNGVLSVIPLFKFTSSSATKITRVIFGGVVYNLLSLGSTSYVGNKTLVEIANRNNEASQISPHNMSNPFGLYTSSPVTTTINTAVDQTLAITGQVVTQASKSVSGITRSGQVATATSTAHGYANGVSVLMAGANETGYNGTFAISNVTANTFDYTVPGTPATPATGTITSALWDTITLESVNVEVKKA